MVLSASLGLLLACNPVALPPQQPQTRAERSNYRETSSYADVVAFLRELMAGSRTMRLEWIGRSAQGRPMPLVVVADDPAITPLKARAENRLVVYVQANIHGGEVEGKEAALRILREIGGRERLARPAWDLTRTVLLVAPIYNIDGNERLGPLARNRPSQDGPDPVGERANGQGFDLNRDCMKAESPEMRAVLEHVYVRWDAHAIMDLHTTNGTRHGYELTYSPPLNPTTEDGVLRYSRDELLPKVRAAHRRATGRDLFDYGNAARPSSGPRWETFGFEPRYVTNYAGVRNRIGVLSEAASFQPFETRVEATVRFVWLVLEQLQRDSAKVVSICRRRVRRSLACASRWPREARRRCCWRRRARIRPPPATRLPKIWSWSRWRSSTAFARRGRPRIRACTSFRSATGPWPSFLRGTAPWWSASPNRGRERWSPFRSGKRPSRPSRSRGGD
jgi:hypothetical protein